MSLPKITVIHPNTFLFRTPMQPQRMAVLGKAGEPHTLAPKLRRGQGRYTRYTIRSKRGWNLGLTPKLRVIFVSYQIFSFLRTNTLVLCLFFLFHFHQSLDFRACSPAVYGCQKMGLVIDANTKGQCSVWEALFHFLLFLKGTQWPTTQGKRPRLSNLTLPDTWMPSTTSLPRGWQLSTPTRFHWQTTHYGSSQPISFLERGVKKISLILNGNYVPMAASTDSGSTLYHRHKTPPPSVPSHTCRNLKTDPCPQKQIQGLVSFF